MTWRTVKLPDRVIERIDALAQERGCSRSRVLEWLLDGRPETDHEEAVRLLAGMARAGKVGAAVALERALRPAAASGEASGSPDPFDELAEHRHARAV